MSFKKLSPGLFVISLAFCSGSQGNLTSAELREFFSKAEFIASRELGADGWPEARRRQMLKRYLKTLAVPFDETASPRDPMRKSDKYRSVTLGIAGAGREGVGKISLALRPGKTPLTDQDFRELQQKCDTGLFAVVGEIARYRAAFSRLEFLVTESCLDLTTQRAPRP